MSGESTEKIPLRLSVSLIGDWQCRLQGVSVARVRGRRAHSLLAYLLINHDKTLERESLSEIFWPDSSQQQARTNLRRELHSLRQWHPIVDTCLSVENSTLLWTMPESYELDTETLLEACDTALSSHWNTLAAKQLPGLKLAPLLPGIRDDWLLDYAEYLRDRFGQALLHLLRSSTAPVSESIYLQLAQRLIVQEPLSEAAYYYCILGCLRQGDNARALRIWHECAAHLQKELDVAPGNLLQSLYPQILEKTVTPDARKSATADYLPDLVGREKEWQSLFSLWNTSNIENQFVLIEGEPGIGKTAIANSLLKYIRQTGGKVTTARAFETGALLAFSPVLSWFQSRLLMDQVTRLDDSMRSVLSALFPEAGHPSEETTSALPDRFRRERFFEALCKALENVEGRKVLFLDDIQWCDSDTLHWLNFLFERKQTCGVVFVATRRDNETIPAGPLNALVESTARSATLHRLKLTAIGHEAARTLVESVLGDNTDKLENEELLSVLAFAGGNPFFILEIARMLSTSGAQNTAAVAALGEGPHKLQELVSKRLTRLAPQPTSALKTVAVLGRAFSDREFALLTGFPPALAAETLDKLINTQFVKPVNASLYEFVHDCIRETILDGLGLPIRRHIHSLIGARLKNGQNAELFAASEIAYHLDAAGEHGSAVVWYKKAALQDNDRISGGAAVQHLDRAIELLQELPGAEKTGDQLVQLLVQKTQCLFTVHGFVSPEIEHSCKQLEAALHRVDELTTKLTSLNCLRVFYGNKNLNKALEIDCECMQVADALRDPTLSISVRRSMGYTRYLFGQLRESSETLAEALSITQRSFPPERFENQAPPSDVAIALSMLSLVYWVSGKPDRSIAVRQTLADYRYERLKPGQQLFTRQFFAHIAFFENNRESLDLETEWFSHTAQIHPNRLIEDFALWTSGMRLFQAEDYASAAHQLRLAATRFDEHATMYQPKRWCQYAQAEYATGNITAAREGLSRGYSSAQQTSQTFWNTELLCLEAQIIHAENADHKRVDSAFLRAIELAQSQQALWLELRTRMAWHQCLLNDGRNNQAAALLDQLLDLHGHLDQYNEIRLAWRQSSRTPDPSSSNLPASVQPDTEQSTEVGYPTPEPES